MAADGGRTRRLCGKWMEIRLPASSSMLAVAVVVELSPVRLLILLRCALLYCAETRRDGVFTFTALPKEDK